MICRDCGTNTGTGAKTAHCRGCCRTFTAEEAFDMHRAGPISARVCVNPEAVGLVQNSRGRWMRHRPDRPRRLAYGPQTDENGSGVSA